MCTRFWRRCCWTGIAGDSTLGVFEVVDALLRWRFDLRVCLACVDGKFRALVRRFRSKRRQFEGYGDAFIGTERQTTLAAMDCQAPIGTCVVSLRTLSIMQASRTESSPYSLAPSHFYSSLGSITLPECDRAGMLSTQRENREA